MKCPVRLPVRLSVVPAHSRVKLGGTDTPMYVIDVQQQNKLD